MTQRKKFALMITQRNALKEYSNYCSRFKEVPQEEITNLIIGCTDVDILEETSEKYRSKMLVS